MILMQFLFLPIFGWNEGKKKTSVKVKLSQPLLTHTSDNKKIEYSEQDEVYQIIDQNNKKVEFLPNDSNQKISLSVDNAISRNTTINGQFAIPFNNASIKDSRMNIGMTKRFGQNNDYSYSMNLSKNNQAPSRSGIGVSAANIDGGSVLTNDPVCATSTLDANTGQMISAGLASNQWTIHAAYKKDINNLHDKPKQKYIENDSKRFAGYNDHHTFDLVNLGTKIVLEKGDVILALSGGIDYVVNNKSAFDDNFANQMKENAKDHDKQLIDNTYGSGKEVPMKKAYGRAFGGKISYKNLDLSGGISSEGKSGAIDRDNLNSTLIHESGGEEQNTPYKYNGNEVKDISYSAGGSYAVLPGTKTKVAIVGKYQKKNSGFTVNNVQVKDSSKSISIGGETDFNGDDTIQAGLYLTLEQADNQSAMYKHDLHRKILGKNNFINQEKSKKQFTLSASCTLNLV